MAQIETRLKCDLDRMVDVEPLRGNLFSADNQANKILVEILKGGAAAEVSGAVYGYVIRQDGETVVVTGELSENVASIVLPSSCYAIVGQISIIIKVATTTVAACTGYVARSTTDTIVDPGHVVPSLAELLAKIADCEAATTAANTAAGNANSKAEEAERVDVAMSKTGNVITVTTTNRNNQQTQKTIMEPTAEASKSGSQVTISVTDGNGTTTATLTEPGTYWKLQVENIPDTTQAIAFDSSGNISSITHKDGNNATVRTDAFTFGTNTITEVRTLDTGEVLTIVTNTDTLATTTTYTAAA